MIIANLTVPDGTTTAINPAPPHRDQPHAATRRVVPSLATRWSHDRGERHSRINSARPSIESDTAPHPARPHPTPTPPTRGKQGRSQTPHGEPSPPRSRPPWHVKADRSPRLLHHPNDAIHTALPQVRQIRWKFPQNYRDPLLADCGRSCGVVSFTIRTYLGEVRNGRTTGSVDAGGRTVGRVTPHRSPGRWSAVGALREPGNCVQWLTLCCVILS